MTVPAPIKKTTPLKLDVRRMKLDVEKTEEVSGKSKQGKVSAEEKIRVYPAERKMAASHQSRENMTILFMEPSLLRGRRKGRIKNPVLNPVKYEDKKKGEGKMGRWGMKGNCKRFPTVQNHKAVPNIRDRLWLISLN